MGRRGRFIVLDGPDGCGKTTQLGRLDEALRARGAHTVRLREPGGTAAGEAIRGLLLDRRELRLTPIVETLLFEAARAQLTFEVIRPALARGAWVLCDRFDLSTTVYQGCAGGVGEAAVEKLSRQATGGLRPDLYLVLWAPPPTIAQRRRARTLPGLDRMEAKGRLFLARVAAAYRRLARARPRRFQLVEARGTVEEVHERVMRSVERLWPRSGTR
jgi:dTMP kinase